MADAAEQRRLRREARQKKILANADDRIQRFFVAPHVDQDNKEEGNVNTEGTKLEAKVEQVDEVKVEATDEHVNTKNIEEEVKGKIRANPKAEMDTDTKAKPCQKEKQDCCNIVPEKIERLVPQVEVATAAVKPTAVLSKKEAMEKRRQEFTKLRRKFSFFLSIVIAFIVYWRLLNGDGDLDVKLDELAKLMFGGVAGGSLDGMPALMSMFVYTEILLISRQYLMEPFMFLPESQPGIKPPGILYTIMAMTEKCGSFLWVIQGLWADFCVFTVTLLLLLVAPLLIFDTNVPETMREVDA